MLVQNAIKITENYPEEFFLVSAHRHDYVSYTFKNGNTVSADGGAAYVRRATSGTSDKEYGQTWMEWCVDDKEPLYAIKEKLLWGTYGKNKEFSIKYVLLKNCETEHLHKILEQKSLGELYKKVMSIDFVFTKISWLNILDFNIFYLIACVNNRLI